MTKKSIQSTGRAMLWVGWLIVLALLTVAFGKVEDHWANPNTSPESSISNNTRQTVLEMNRYGHYVATGFINGQQVVFLVDTGASSVSIPEPIANELNLSRGPGQRVNTANGQITVYRTSIDRLTIGNIELYDVEASINPHMDGDILLGMSALRSVDFQQRNQTLTLEYAVD